MLLLPFFLAIGAVTMKLSALPLLLVSLIFCCFYDRKFRMSNIVVAGGTVLIFLVPLISVNVVASGCPLYPSPTFCTDLPWSVGENKARQMTAVIRRWAQWAGPKPEDATSLNWIVPWLGIRKEATFLILLSVLSGFMVSLKLMRAKLQGKNYILGIAFLGTALMLYSAPSTRFGLGFLIVLPALMGALIVQANMTFGTLLFLVCTAVFSFLTAPVDSSTIILVIILLLYIGFISGKFIRQEQRVVLLIGLPLALLLICLVPSRRILYAAESDVDRSLVPPAIEALTAEELVEVEAGNFTYYKPAKRDQCAASALPCTPYLTRRPVCLRDENSGLGSGFYWCKNEEESAAIEEPSVKTSLSYVT